MLAFETIEDLTAPTASIQFGHMAGMASQVLRQCMSSERLNEVLDILQRCLVTAWGVVNLKQKSQGTIVKFRCEIAWPDLGTWTAETIQERSSSCLLCSKLLVAEWFLYSDVDVP